MRRVIFLLLAVLFLWGCTPQEPASAYITVSLALPEGCQVTENRVEIPSGGDAVFELTLDEGYELSSVDYDGEYSTEYLQGKYYIRLHSVRYPTMASVELTDQFCTIIYDPNGAAGEAYSVVYDRSLHLRPNTSIGTDRLSREGYTLTGWNTEPDGSGTAVSLGSRVSVPGKELTLYAQWSKWSDESLFTWEVTEDGIRLTGYHGTEDVVTVPATLDGLPVTVVGSGTFLRTTATHVILPATIKILQINAFERCALQELTFFDNIEAFGDVSFELCEDFSTVHINAVEAPYGYNYRRESCFADKMDILIEAQGQRKIVFYGGCSMWYNLDGQMTQEALGDSIQVINMGLNGIVNSSAQMQIISYYMEDGDIFFHTPEISSEAQLMLRTEMINHDRKLWCGMEYNYDLVSLLDIRTLPEFFDIFYYWLSKKEPNSSYTDVYLDYLGNDYVDEYGCASFYRDWNDDELEDRAALDPMYMDEEALGRLEAHYKVLQDRGVTIYVSYACINLDAVPEEQQGNTEMMDALFRESFSNMEGVTVLGSLLDHVYHNTDFYDTNYHLLTVNVQRTTAYWLEDLVPQLRADGFLPEA